MIIDPHYEVKHAESVSDDLIIKLVQALDGKAFDPTDLDPPFSYFRTDPITVEGKKYRVIWLLEDDQIYIGVVNAHRR